MNKALWIARLLQRRGELSKEQILDAWRDEDDRARPMAQSTFYDNLRLLAERYGLVVERERRMYRLKTGKGASHPLLGNSSREEDSETPEICGAHWIRVLGEAIESCNAVQMTYAPFDKAPFTTELSPYCLRTFERRGYVVGRSSHHADIRTFAADRIEHLQVLPRHFRRDASFSANDYFRHSFGVYGGRDIRPVEVVLKSTEREAKYLRTAPLHSSQRELEPAADGSPRFTLKLGLTEDFLAALMAHGIALTVERPAELRETLRERADSIARKY